MNNDLTALYDVYVQTIITLLSEVIIQQRRRNTNEGRKKIED